MVCIWGGDDDYIVTAWCYSVLESNLHSFGRRSETGGPLLQSAPDPDQELLMEMKNSF